MATTAVRKDKKASNAFRILNRGFLKATGRAMKMQDGNALLMDLWKTLTSLSWHMKKITGDRRNWYLDSCASLNMCNTKSCFWGFAVSENSRKVETASRNENLNIEAQEKF